MNFYQLCETKGIELLKDDIRHIKSCISRTPTHLRQQILKSYIDEWLVNEAKCESAARARNTGRRAANLWILDNHQGVPSK